MAKQLEAICPICNGTTDTGGECNDCGFDWQNDDRSEKQKYVDEWKRLESSCAEKPIDIRKQTKADFLRHNQYGSPVNYAPYDIA